MTPLQDALMEADRQSERRGIVWETLCRVTDHFHRLNVPYAIVGGIAMQHFGIQRSTQDVDVLLGSEADLRHVHQFLVGHGYLLKSTGSKHLRDEITCVRIEFLIAGDYPGDGKPKPVRFPDPSQVGEESDEGIRFINLRTLVELKLASAKSAAHRIRDRADVLELIHALGLSPEFAARLDPYVRDEFRQLALLPPPNERE